MKKLQKGFTLVELIVVITILAILGTIAFISLQGYSQDAKNAKVSSDLSTLSSAIEIALTDGTLSGLSTLVETASTDGAIFTTANDVAATETVTLFNDTNSTSSAEVLDDSAVKYSVGAVDFAALRQNGDDFKDNAGKNYIAAIAYSGSTAYYQLAGQKKETSGTFTAVIKGNYVAQTGDTDGLISSAATDAGVSNGASFATDTVDLY